MTGAKSIATHNIMHSMSCRQLHSLCTMRYVMANEEAERRNAGKKSKKNENGKCIGNVETQSTHNSCLYYYNSMLGLRIVCDTKFVGWMVDDSVSRACAHECVTNARRPFPSASTQPTEHTLCSGRAPPIFLSQFSVVAFDDGFSFGNI